MPIDIKAEAEELRNSYITDPRQSTYNCLITSESGCGKTFLARTCRFPVHIDSFDPGGTKGLRKWVESGDIIVDSSYESEDPKHPTAYDNWRKNFKRRAEGGYFDKFGTYILDSATTWAQAVMNWVMKKDGVAGEAPRFTKDYVPQKIEMRNMLRICLDLPCDFILTGHLRIVEDQEAGRQKFRFLTTGDGMVTIPLLFDELYVLVTKTKSSGVEYQLLTKSTTLYTARSRLAADGKLEAIEEPNIKAILKKVGYPCEDKPRLLLGNCSPTTQFGSKIT